MTDERDLQTIRQRVAALEAELASARAELERRAGEASEGRAGAEAPSIKPSLHASEEQYRMLAEASRDFIFIIDCNDIIRYVNSYSASAFHCRPEDMIGRPRREFFPPDVGEHQLTNMERVRATGEPIQVEGRLKYPTGEMWIHTSLVPIRNAAGTVTDVLGISRDITERKRIEEEREELLRREQAARSKAQEASAVKDHFLAVLSHELRNPLMAALAGIHVLRRTLPKTTRTSDTLEVIERSIKLQARLIGDLLDLSRARHGKITLEKRPVSLAAVVEAVLDLLQAESERSGLSLRKSLEYGGWVLGDPDRIQQIVFNLLANAIKFTAPGGEVRVALRAGELAEIVIEDTGVGIDPSFMPHVFEIFQQGEASPQRSGLGIGLALVKELAEMHGGSVRAESDGLGKGARFTVRLPTVAPPATARCPPRVEHVDKPITLLIVEDDHDARRQLHDAFVCEGYLVIAAGGAEEALELLKRNRPDFILADIGLPRMNGYDFLRHARKAGVGAPALAVSGLGQAEDVRQSRLAGFVQHFVKPVDIRAIDEYIHEQLGTRGNALG